jgi:hypothetical protein
MKKILAILMCAMLVCMMPVVAFADEVVEGDATLDETPVETPPEETPGEDEKTEEEIQAELTTEKIVNYIKDNLEEWSVIITLVLTVFYNARKHMALNKSMATMNNNTVSVAQNSAEAIANTVTGLAGMTEVVNSYKAKMEEALAEVRANEEEKREMKAMLSETTEALKTSKAANIELANEVAELLILANIPNSKKDELYARHRAAVDAIAAAEETEVKGNDGEEA